MSEMSVDQFEKAYADPIPINGHILVEVVSKDPNRKLKSGILLQEESLGPTTPYFVVVAKCATLHEWDLEEGDIIQQKSRNVLFFHGKEMRKLAMVHKDDITAIFKLKAKKATVTKEKPPSKIIIDN